MKVFKSNKNQLFDKWPKSQVTIKIKKNHLVVLLTLLVEYMDSSIGGENKSLLAYEYITEYMQ